MIIIYSSKNISKSNYFMFDLQKESKKQKFDLTELL